jgi:hypothetical protein
MSQIVMPIAVTAILTDRAYDKCFSHIISHAIAIVNKEISNSLTQRSQMWIYWFKLSVNVFFKKFWKFLVIEAFYQFDYHNPEFVYCENGKIFLGNHCVEMIPESLYLKANNSNLYIIIYTIISYSYGILYLQRWNLNCYLKFRLISW